MAPTSAPSATLGNLICQMIAEYSRGTDTAGCQGKCAARVLAMAPRGTATGPTDTPAANAMTSTAAAAKSARAPRLGRSSLAALDLGRQGLTQPGMAGPRRRNAPARRSRAGAPPASTSASGLGNVGLSDLNGRP